MILLKCFKISQALKIFWTLEKKSNFAEST
jgi:hypothetical protein